MKLIAGGVTFEFRQPPFATIRRRRAVHATAMTMPEAAVDKDNCLVFDQHHVRSAGKFLAVETEAKTEPVQQ